MLNHITIMGRLTRDPELRYTQSQKPVANFTLAVDRDLSDKKTDFIDCVAWNSVAELISKHFTKGRLMAAEGRLEIRDWTDNDGNKRRIAEVNVYKAYFCDKAKKAESEAYGSPAPQFRDLPDDGDGELPF